MNRLMSHHPLLGVRSQPPPVRSSYEKALAMLVAKILRDYDGDTVKFYDEALRRFQAHSLVLSNEKDDQILIPGR